jgi:hypothetical protein
VVNRWMLAGVVTAALLASGCSSGKVTVITPSAKPTSSSASTSTETSEASETSEEETSTEPGAPEDADKCTDLTGANLDLALASTTEDAKKQADIFAKYDPPGPVQEAIDHFVETKGPQLDDPKYDEYDKRITDWVKQECP